MACSKVTQIMLVGLLVLLIVNEAAARRSTYRYRSSRYRSSANTRSGGGGGGLGTTGAIILGSIFGGLFVVAVVIGILWYTGVFKKCTANNKTTPKKSTALMYNPTPGDNGSKIQQVHYSKGPKGTNDYFPQTFHSDPAYPPPPPVYKY